MMTPLVSVLLPSYNHAAFVKDAIDSVLAQRGVSFELLVQDDASGDASARVISEFRDPRIQFTASSANQGQCATLNNLLRRASGRYVAIINSDDVWPREDKLAIQVEYLEAHPNVGASFTAAEHIGADGKLIPEENMAFGDIFKQSNRSRGMWLRRFLFEGNCLCHSSVMVRRSVHEELGFYDTRLRQIPDLPLWVEIVKRYELHVHPEVLAQFRIVAGENASAPNLRNTRRLTNEFLFALEPFFDGADEPLLREGFADLVVNPGSMSREELEVEKALLYFLVRAHAGPVCWMIGLRKMHALLGNSAYAAALSNYGIDGAWFQQQMATFSPFIDRPPQEGGAQEAPPPPRRTWPLLRYLGLGRGAR